MLAHASFDPQKLLVDAKSHVRALFAQDGAPSYPYHNLEHTQMVVRDALWIGKGSNLTDRQMFIVEIAAWFHDSGFSKTYLQHEEAGAVLAATFLSLHKVDSSLIAQVADCIRATRMPQQPEDIVQEVLCDADLAYLGSNQFFVVSEKLLNEWQQHKQNDLDEIEFSMVSEGFLLRHTYFTPFARTYLNAGKKRNLELIGIRNRNKKTG
jgi:predicted metal-dependent HD superfamily phosphohydrolase